MAGAVTGPKAARYLEFAANMTIACYQLYNQTASGACQPVESALCSTGEGRHLQRTESCCAEALLPCQPVHPAGLGAEYMNFDANTGQVQYVDSQYLQRPEVRRWQGG